MTMPAYAGMAEVWAGNAALAYRPLAEHLLRRVPEGVGLALDAGAGTGLVGTELRRRGWRVVSADLEPDMARHLAQSGPAVAADLAALPFGSGAFGLVVGAFVVNHLADPVAGLRELRRVAGTGATVLVSTFSTSRASAKAAVDQVAAAYGMTVPDWYCELQAHAALTGTTHRMATALSAAGFSQFAVHEGQVDIGLTDPADVVRYRLGLPHLARFVAGLSPDRRAAFLAAATAAVRDTGERFAPEVVEVVALA